MNPKNPLKLLLVACILTGVIFTSYPNSSSQKRILAQTISSNPSMTIVISDSTTTKPIATLDVEQSYQVSEVKELIKQKTGIPAESQKLIHKGKQLKKGRTLSDYHIKDGDKIHLYNRSLLLAQNEISPKRLLVSFNVNVQGNDLIKTYGINLDENEPVYKLRDYLRNICKINIDDMHLVFNDQQLRDYDTISSYGIKVGSNVAALHKGSKHFIAQIQKK